MTKRTCRECCQEKEIIYFGKSKRHKDGIDTLCLECSNNSRARRKRGMTKEQYLEHKNDKISLKIKEKTLLIRKCQKCGIEKEFKMFPLINNTTNRRHDCSECTKKYIKKYRIKYDEEHKEENKIRQRKWLDENFTKVRERRKRYDKTSDRKLKILYKNRIRNGLRDYKRDERYSELIGCSFKYLKERLQKTAIDNGYLQFNINSYNGRDFHIDHIIPIDAFNLKCSFHRKLCFNWGNLQILKAEENLKKNNKIIDGYVNKSIIQI